MTIACSAKPPDQTGKPMNSAARNDLLHLQLPGADRFAMRLAGEIRALGFC